MTQPIRLRTGRNLEDLHAQEIAAAAQMGERRAAATAEPRPGRRRNAVKIDAPTLDDRNRLARRPVEIGIDQIAKIGLPVAHLPHPAPVPPRAKLTQSSGNTKPAARQTPRTALSARRTPL